MQLGQPNYSEHAWNIALSMNNPLFIHHFLHPTTQPYLIKHMQLRHLNMDIKMSIIAECPGYIQVFSDGTVKRFTPETAPPTTRPSKGYISKDVVIDPSKPITARIFLPQFPVLPATALPVVVYFHGGGFCIGSTTWLGYHTFLGDLSVKAKTIVLSVDYRLSPENKLPIAYEDCYSALEWLHANSHIEPLLQLSDLNRVFLSGDSAGANIAHQVAIKAIQSGNNSIGLIKGLLLIHPYFGSEQRTELELEDGSSGKVEMNEMFWGLSLPQGSNRDFYGCNFEKAYLSDDQWSQFPAVVVYVAELDFLRGRGELYAQFIKKKGVKGVDLVEAEGESHVYHVFHPKSDATSLLQKKMTEFIQIY